MRITVPISVHDFHLLPKWSKINRYLHCGLNHELHFVAAPSVAEAAQNAKAELEGEFESVTVHVIQQEPVGGWPVASNAQFWACATLMAENNPNAPWMLVELDCLPIKKTAYDAPAARYASAGTPYFGTIARTPWRNDETGRICPSLEGGNDVMMSGCAIYPGNILTHEDTKGLMADFMKGGESIDVPWDMHLRGAIRNKQSHTELIAQHWNTVNYRSDGQFLYCDGRNTHEIFEKNPTWEIRMCGGRVHPDAVMIHGCKDDSLASLVLNDEIPDSFATRKAIHTEQPKSIEPPKQEPSAADSRIAELEAKLERVTGLLEKQLRGNDEKSLENPKSRTDAELPAKPVPASTADEVDALIPENGSIVLVKLAKKAYLKPEKLRQILDDHHDRFTIKGPSSWVSRAKVLEPA